MPTENPKISAYVPQLVYNAFREYQKQRGLSMSQAAIEIFVEYFGLNLEEPQQEYTGGLPGRLIQLEKSLTELKELYFNLASKVEQVQTTGKLLTRVENGIPQFNEEVETNSELLSNLQDELLQGEQAHPIDESDLVITQLPSEPLVGIDDKNDEVKAEESSNSITELVELKNLESGVQLNLIESLGSSVSSLLKELSLSAVKLGERLSIDRTTIGSRAKKKSLDEFATMAKTKDPDSIPWVYSEQLKRYVPYGELSVEQIENLKAWKECCSAK